MELHVFADASESAYGSCTYLRCEHESSDCCNLVSSITRVSPLARQTIPRLELLACLVSARLSQSLRRALHGSLTIDRIVYWSDSTVALSWIRGLTKEYKQFVQNRVTEIRSLTCDDSLRYCPTKENPADIASRGVSATELVNDEKWWHGPKFLCKPEEEWPTQPSGNSNQELVS